MATTHVAVYMWTIEAAAHGRGWRYRWTCTCGRQGQWRMNPNDADGDYHLFRQHGIGE